MIKLITIIKENWKIITVIGSILFTTVGFTLKKTIEFHDLTSDVSLLKKEMVEQKNTSQKIFEKLEQINTSVVRTEEYVKNNEREKDREALNRKTQ